MRRAGGCDSSVLTWQEPVTLWDVDLPEDVDRLRTIGLANLIP